MDCRQRDPGVATPPHAGQGPTCSSATPPTPAHPNSGRGRAIAPGQAVNHHGPAGACHHDRTRRRGTAHEGSSREQGSRWRLEFVRGLGSLSGDRRAREVRHFAATKPVMPGRNLPMDLMSASRFRRTVYTSRASVGNSSAGRRSTSVRRSVGLIGCLAALAADEDRGPPLCAA